MRRRLILGVGVALVTTAVALDDRPSEHDPDLIPARVWPSLSTQSLDAGLPQSAPRTLALVHRRLLLNQTVSIVAMGGSNTHGQGCGDYIGCRWTARLQKLLPRARVFNRAEASHGVCSYASLAHAVVVPWLIEANASALVVETATNDGAPAPGAELASLLKCTEALVRAVLLGYSRELLIVFLEVPRVRGIVGASRADAIRAYADATGPWPARYGRAAAADSASVCADAPPPGGWPSVGGGAFAHWAVARCYRGTVTQASIPHALTAELASRPNAPAPLGAALGSALDAQGAPMWGAAAHLGVWTHQIAADLVARLLLRGPGDGQDRLDADASAASQRAATAPLPPPRFVTVAELRGEFAPAYHAKGVELFAIVEQATCAETLPAALLEHALATKSASRHALPAQACASTEAGGGWLAPRGLQLPHEHAGFVPRHPSLWFAGRARASADAPAAAPPPGSLVLRVPVPLPMLPERDFTGYCVTLTRLRSYAHVSPLRARLERAREADVAPSNWTELASRWDARISVPHADVIGVVRDAPELRVRVAPVASGEGEDHVVVMGLRVHPLYGDAACVAHA